MCASHTCIRSALTQAFRPPHYRRAIAWTIPDFLAPAVSKTPRRTFSSSRRRNAELEPSSQNLLYPVEQSREPAHPFKSSKERLDFRVTLPDADDARTNIEPWLAAIDPFLPLHLRRTPTDGSSVAQEASAIDLAWILNAAQDASYDILSHIGLVEGRWAAVVWISKKLAEGGLDASRGPPQLEPSANVIWPETEFRSLNDVTNSPLLTERVRPSRTLKHSLDDLTSAPDSIQLPHNAKKSGLGQLWRSLGCMIVEATDRTGQANPDIMSHVLEIIAYLHHAGLISESIYQYRPAQDASMLQQPPTLHMLSSKILSALSDATWTAHEASVKATKNASYFLGHEIPGSRYKVAVGGLAPALWLELVLWSCFYGGWFLDGSAILEKVLATQKDIGWRLISWRELTAADEFDPSIIESAWRHFRWGPAAKATTAEHKATHMALSSEVVAAFVDNLINTVRVGVGARGTNPETILNRITNLKKLLDMNSLSLGSTSWDSVIVRLLESGGVVPEKRPELLLDMIKIASTFGTEVGSANASSQDDRSTSSTPYHFDPSTASIGLLHRSLRSFIDNGDVSAAMTTLEALQGYTDKNKQRSSGQSFERLSSGEIPKDQPFDNILAPIDFPVFDLQLSKTLLAKLLNLVTDARLLDVGRWLISPRELDAPLIDNSMYSDWYIAAALIRYGTVARRNDLVLSVVEQSIAGRQGVGRLLPAPITTALLNSQIEQQRWESVRGIQKFVVENPGYTPHATVIANFAASMLRLSGGANAFLDSKTVQARDAFRELLFAWEGPVLTNIRNELYCILGVVSSVHEDWRGFCSQFLSLDIRQDIKLSTDDFNQVLNGVLDGFGSNKGKHLIDMWCFQSPRTFKPYRAPGGLPAMPQFRVGKGEEYENRPNDIVITQSSGTRLILQGRVLPNRQTVLAVLRKVQRELDEIKLDQITESKSDIPTEKNMEFKATLKWAARLLYYLGFDHEDITRDLVAAFSVTVSSSEAVENRA
ncbi:hypothetical protein BDV96DRAFT_614583 [Lophiotrema nucula]|uniref:Uncharacterized protein n=1 Tax=Lophiotrema nucula TaxID=690887 RepID=A0A6A5YYQ2_9PLEO|nr:hypothetical protein BDV96DRAFT_614583 [Lophiotrema nucula]